jgi:indole-3-glycerol phosphate synthase
MPSILDKIVATKRQEIAQARDVISLDELKAATKDAPPVRDFFTALATPQEISLIAEVKKASPSKGLIRKDFDPLEIASAYESNGASCISVLTDVSYFQGSLDYLRAIRQQASIPLIRKDFIVDEYQIYEARAAGADAVLLIAECLDDAPLHTLYALIRELGMTALVELHDERHLPRLLDAGVRLIGVNNRDLHTFEVDIQRTLTIREQIPADRLVVGESGIRNREDVERLQNAGVNAMLVGETLMRRTNVGAAVAELLGRPTKS